MRFVFRRTLLATLAAVTALVTPTPVANAATSTGHPEAPQEFVALRDVAPTIIEEIRYHGSHNFVGRPITGYREPLCIVTRPTALALREAQRRLLAQGYTLKVYDCFRPQRAVDSFVRWAQRLDDDRMKNEFYPRVEKSSLFEDGYIAEHSGHSRGSTVDLTLVRIPPHPQERYRPGDPLRPCFAPAGERFGDNSVDMGTGFDCFDTLSHTDDPRITDEAMRNRTLLKDTLAAVGMENYPNEWWHYTLRDEPFPDTYFDFPVARRSLNG
ncbi:M15 family metallopeptidase [Saccharomonospora cyanea]|uniref:D-alanyl-D-alanine dipeptidase n=1 Tax=Saccharomonospora cyanea NA-134 TaxID=882082 RepID=H5XIA7_9PSEU|nr:M15 family metallopeptidase [Saccharomonospora cyanea]EHR61735.1 D-alanyl-D-alanine dipeptidase [Saccharomonospora cyanea NA-134]